jgi:hypothetical protein
LVKAGDDVEKCCLSGTIGSDQASDRAWTNGKARSVNGMDSAEAFVNIFDNYHEFAQ